MGEGGGGGVLKRRYVAIAIVLEILIATFCLPINAVHARVQNISITRLVDKPHYKETFFVITTSEGTYHILVTANISVVDRETIINLTATLTNPHNFTIVASARIPDTLTDAPYLQQPVQAFLIHFEDAVVQALKAVLPVVIIVALVIEIYMDLAHIIGDVLEEILDIVLFGNFIYSSIPWVLLTLLNDTNPDGSFDLFIPYSPIQEHLQLLLGEHYFLATSLSWWEIVKHVVYAPWPFNWIELFSWFSAEFICSRTGASSPRPPHASFEWNPIQPIVGERVNFTSTSYDPDGFITAYHWWLDDGNESTQESLTYVYSQVGDYNVTLEVTDNSSRTDNVTHTVSVLPETEARLRVIPDYRSVEVPTGRNATAKLIALESLNRTDLQQVAFRATNLRNPEGDIISSGNVTFDENGITIERGSYTNITVSFHAPASSPIGWYNGNITASSDNGGNATVFVNLYVFGPPLANFTWNPLTPKIGESVTFDASYSMPSYGGPIARYEWDFGDSGHATGKIVTHKYTTKGNYSVTLNVTGSKGLLNTTSKRIKVVKPEGPNAFFTPKESIIYEGETVTFDASASTPGWNGTHEMPITEYRWDFGDSNETTTSTSIAYHSFSSSGIYYVTLTVYAPGATPETDATTGKVTVKPFVPPPVGGHSSPIKRYTTFKPLISYLTLTAILTITFTAIKHKTPRKQRKNP